MKELYPITKQKIHNTLATSSILMLTHERNNNSRRLYICNLTGVPIRCNVQAKYGIFKNTHHVDDVNTGSFNTTFVSAFAQFFINSEAEFLFRLHSEHAEGDLRLFELSEEESLRHVFIHILDLYS